MTLLVSDECHKYSILATDTALFSVSLNFGISQIAELKKMNFDLSLVPIEAGQTIRLNSIFFETESSVLEQESMPELERMVKIMNDHTSLKIEISGHTDEVGNADDNIKLSQARALAVFDNLVARGLPKGRIIAKGYGETKPVAGNETEEGRRLNRRVEFTILEK